MVDANLVGQRPVSLTLRYYVGGSYRFKRIQFIFTAQIIYMPFEQCMKSSCCSPFDGQTVPQWHTMNYVLTMICIYCQCMKEHYQAQFLFNVIDLCIVTLNLSADEKGDSLFY